MIGNGKDTRGGRKEVSIDQTKVWHLEEGGETQPWKTAAICPAQLKSSSSQYCWSLEIFFII